MVAAMPLGAYAKDESSALAFEVKFVLDEKVLDASDKSKVDSAYIEAFELKKVTPIKVVYIDTDDRTFFKAGWINRLRVKDSAKKFEYTFKKRYSVEGDNIAAAIEKAKTDGIADAGFEAEIDWSFDKMTLSYKLDADISNEGYENLDLPSISNALKTAKKNMPQVEVKEKGKKWGTAALKSSTFIGPVVFKRYKGKIDGQKIDLEVWPIENQKTKEVRYIAEVSFDAKSYDEAKETRQKIMDKLSEMGILKSEASLKTNLMYEAFAK